MSSANETERQAAAWLARQDRGLTAEEEGVLKAWLGESYLNKVAYLRLQSVWQRADRLAALRHPEFALSGGAEPRHAGMRMRPWLAIAAVFMLALLGAGLFFLNKPPSTSYYATDVGRQQVVKLADGSSIELNTNTRVHTDITSTRRLVVLDSGEAYFDVVHDANRPFVVLAGKHRITDLGTKFSVLRDGNDVRVIVKEGRVRVDDVSSPDVATPMVVTQGNVLIDRNRENLVITRDAQDIANALGWRQGMLVFNKEALSDVAVEFNRYNSKQIVIEGGARTIRIGGSFRADNIDVFTQLLHQGFGLSVKDSGNKVFVSR
jgi:transmembrane sensor